MVEQTDIFMLLKVLIECLFNLSELTRLNPTFFFAKIHSQIFIDVGLERGLNQRFCLYSRIQHVYKLAQTHFCSLRFISL